MHNAVLWTGVLRIAIGPINSAQGGTLVEADGSLSAMGGQRSKNIIERLTILPVAQCYATWMASGAGDLAFECACNDGMPKAQ